MKYLWPDQLLLEARSCLSNRTRLFFPVSPRGWRGCRCLFWLWPTVTMICVWALVPGLPLAPVQSPAWCYKSFCLMLVCLKGTELQLHLARKAGSRDFCRAIFCAYLGGFLIVMKIPLNTQLILQTIGLQHLSLTVEQQECRNLVCCPISSLFGCSVPINDNCVSKFLKKLWKISV